MIVVFSSFHLLSVRVPFPWKIYADLVYLLVRSRIGRPRFVQSFILYNQVFLWMRRLLLPSSLAVFSCCLLLPSSLAVFSCRLLLPSSLAVFSCRLLLPSSLAVFSCRLLLPSSLAVFSCRPVCPAGWFLIWCCVGWCAQMRRACVVSALTTRVRAFQRVSRLVSHVR